MTMVVVCQKIMKKKYLVVKINLLNDILQRNKFNVRYHVLNRKRYVYSG